MTTVGRTDTTLGTTLVSVIVPTYNRAYCIAETIDSVLRQTYKNLEIIIVDDGSTDETGALIERRYADSRVRYTYQQNAGVCGARNRGFQLARGEYIALLDSDDIWEPWKLELQIACFRHNPELGMVWTDMVAIDPEGSVISSAYLRQMYSAYRWFEPQDLFSSISPLSEAAPTIGHLFADAKLHTGEIFSQMVMGNLVHTSTVVLTRDRLTQVGGFNVDLAHAGEDYDFHLRTCREGPVGFVNVGSIKYRRGRPDQLSRYRLQIASNFLKTITSAITNDRKRITLPQHMLDHVMAEAHQWVGYVLIRQGQNAEARSHLFNSLKYRMDPETFRYFALSLVPESLRPVVRKGLHGLRVLRRSNQLKTAH